MLEIDDERWRVRVVRAICRTLAAAGVSAAPAEDEKLEAMGRREVPANLAGQPVPWYRRSKSCRSARPRSAARGLSHEHEHRDAWGYV